MVYCLLMKHPVLAFSYECDSDAETFFTLTLGRKGAEVPSGSKRFNYSGKGIEKASVSVLGSNATSRAG